MGSWYAWYEHMCFEGLTRGGDGFVCGRLPVALLVEVLWVLTKSSVPWMAKNHPRPGWFIKNPSTDWLTFAIFEFIIGEVNNNAALSRLFEQIGFYGTLWAAATLQRRLCEKNKIVKRACKSCNKVEHLQYNSSRSCHACQFQLPLGLCSLYCREFKALHRPIILQAHTLTPRQELASHELSSVPFV